MDLTIPTSVAYVAAWLGIITGIRKLFKDTEEDVLPGFKKSVAAWIQNLKPAEKITNWPDQFAQLFDSVFGKKHFTLKCFLRSSLASLISATLMFFIWGILRPNEFHAFYLDPDLVYNFLILLFFVGILNLIPDYFSLLETRYMLRWLNNSYSVKRAILGILIDGLVTAVIFWIGLNILSVLVLVFVSDTSFVVLFIKINKEFLTLYLPLKATQMYILPLGITFYSTFFTSAWLWLYVISGIILKSLKYFGVMVEKAGKIFDLENKPISALGNVASVFVTFIFAVIAFYQLIIN